MASEPLNSRAALYALAGCACWVVGDVFLKLAGETSVPKYEIMAAAAFSGMVSILVAARLRGGWVTLLPRRYGRLALLGLWMLAGYMAYLMALPRLPLANFYVIVFLAPILISALAAFFFREAWSFKQIGATLFGFIGVVIAVGPGSLPAGGEAAAGYCAAFAAMLCITLQLLTVRLLGRSESRECIAFYPRLGPCLGGLAFMLIWGAEPMPLTILMYSLAIGGIGGIGWMLMAHAYKLAPAAMVAPFQYSEILFGALAGFLIWGDVPSMHLLIGGAVIIASGVYIARYAKIAVLASIE